MTIHIPCPSVVLLIGPSGSGKSTFARCHFLASEVLSSDACRAMVCDNENDQSASTDAFELLFLLLEKRLQRKRVTVVDATNVQAAARKLYIEAARTFSIPLIGIVFLLPTDVCQSRNRQRTRRVVPEGVILAQMASLQNSLESLESEGFSQLHRLTSVSESESLVVVRDPQVPADSLGESPRRV